MDKPVDGGSRDISRPVKPSSMKFCVMCGKRKGDRMLVCAETGCPVAFHVKCFPREPKFDQSRRFYCPYCSYKGATGKLEKLKRKATQAKLDLLGFLDAGGTDRCKRGQKLANASTSRSENRGNVAVSPEKHANASASRDENQGDDAVSPQKQANASASRNENHGNDDVSLEKAGSAAGKGPCLGKEVANAERSNPPKQSPKEVKNVTISKLRRKRSNWTTQEEEMLEEGVRKFSDEEMKNVPRRKILDFGSQTFHSTRTPSDLKDKWKNIQRRNLMDNPLGKEPIEDEIGEENLTQESPKSS